MQTETGKNPEVQNRKGLLRQNLKLKEQRGIATQCGLNLSSNAEQLEIKIELKLKIEFQI